jgi:hypothetical protein
MHLLKQAISCLCTKPLAGLLAISLIIAVFSLPNYLDVEALTCHSNSGTTQPMITSSKLRLGQLRPLPVGTMLSASGVHLNTFKSLTSLPSDLNPLLAPPPSQKQETGEADFLRAWTGQNRGTSAPDPLTASRPSLLLSGIDESCLHTQSISTQGLEACSTSHLRASETSAHALESDRFLALSDLEEYCGHDSQCNPQQLWCNRVDALLHDLAMIDLSSDTQSTQWHNSMQYRLQHVRLCPQLATRPLARCARDVSTRYYCAKAYIAALSSF